VHDTNTDPRYIASHPGIRSEVAVPLIAQDRVIGVMDLESERVGFFTDDQVRTLSLLAPQIASSIENARLYEELAERERRMEEDLKAAHELQSLLLPTRAPEFQGLDVAVGLRPARGISGDIYDFFEQSDHHTVIAFGDSSGKGAAAALYGALVAGLLRTIAPGKRSPSAVLRELNGALIERKIEARYVTLLVLLWHPHAGKFSMANAGALPPMVCRDGEILKLKVEGVPLGLLESREYEELPLQTKPGDIIVLYSDGITDHLSLGGEEYGRGRLARIVRGSCGLSAQQIVEAIFDDMDRFATKAFDDQTILVLKVK
jgi:sigma-B regulation protein RsbU (phosphoserine phosphatase)